MVEVIKTTKFQILFIVIVTSLVYINTLVNGLVWDDHLFVEKWKDMQNFDIASLVKGSSPQAQGRLYRPIRSIIYAIDYKLWGQNPFFYHLQAILIHVGATVLVFYIVRLIISDSLFTKNMSLRGARASRGGRSNLYHDGIASLISFARNDKGGIPFAAALLFGLHPIHTETIDYISASMETWGSLFFFLSFYLYLTSCHPERSASWRRVEGSHGILHFVQNDSRILYIFSIVSALLAFFTYEMTLTLPLLIMLYEVCVVGSLSSRGAPPVVIARNEVTKQSQKRLPRFLRSLAMTIPYFALAFFYLITRTLILGLVSRTEYLAYSFYHTMLTMVKVFAQYILLLFFPFNLTTNHRLVGDFPSSMLPYDRLDPILRQSIFDKDVLLGLFVLLAILALAIKLVRKHPIITFGIGWFFISLLPVSYIIPHGGAMAEKYLYIASFGFVLLLAVILNSFQNLVFSGSRSRNKFGMTINKFGMTVVLLLALFYGILTFQRNTVWRNDITLFTDMERKAPNNLLATYTLGVLYGERNHFDIAESYYQKAINKAPDFWEAHYNLGNIYTRVGREVLAKREYEKVLELNPDFVNARNNLKIVLQHASGSALPTPKEIKKETVLTVPSKTQGLVKYSFGRISFEYPKGWSIKETEKGIVINDNGAGFTIEMTLEEKPDTVSASEYVSQQKENFGKLVNQGLAKIPNMDFAYVKVWDKKLQFFLFKKELVVKVLVYPSDSANMKEFDGILGSIKISN